MKNIPVFTLDSGTATLILREIPYKSIAYVIARSVLPGQAEAFARECGDFCRAAGAKEVFFAPADPEETCPWELSTDILSMTCPRERLLGGDACLIPVQPETAGIYREHYNRAMAPVPNAATMEKADEERLLSEGGSYFVHKEGRLLGLGQIQSGTLEAVISIEPHQGETVVRALASVPGGTEDLTLQVASANLPAMKLYNRLGFVKTRLLSRWYRLP